MGDLGDKLNELWIKCEQFKIANNIEASKETLSEILSVAPNHPFTNFLAGQYYNEFEEFTKAISCLEKTEGISDDFKVMINIELGKSYFGLKDYNKAISFFEKTKEPGYIYADWYLGSCYKRLGDFTNAIIHFENYKGINKEDSATDYDIGYCYCLMKDFKKALFYLEQAKQNGVDNGNINFYLGHCYLGLKYMQKAIHHYKIAKKQKFNEKEININLALSYFHINDFKKAIFYFEKSLGLGLDDEKIFFTMGNCYFGLKNNLEAIKCYEKCIELNPEDNKKFAYSNLGRCYLSMGNIDKGLESFLEAYKLDPTDPIFLSYLGDCYSSLGKEDIADYYFSKALEIDPNNSIAYLFLGKRCTLQGNFNEALIYCINSLCGHTRSLFGSVKKDQYLLLSTAVNGLGGIKNTISFLEEVVNNSQQDLNLSFIYASLLDFEGYKEEFLNLSKKIVSSIKEDLELNPQEQVLQTLDQKSANPVKISILSPVSEHTYIIKTNDLNKDYSEEKRRIFEENSTLIFLRQVLKEYVGIDNYINIPVPISCFELDGGVYLFEKRENLPTLSELSLLLIEEELTEELKKVLETLALVHGSISKEIKKDEKGYFLELEEENAYEIRLKQFNYLEDFMARAIIGKSYDKNPRLQKNGKFEEFMGEFTKFMQQPNLEYFLHGDLNANNVMANGFIVDFERKTVGNFLKDLTNLVECLEFDNLNKQELIEYYADVFLGLQRKKDFWKIVEETYEKNKLYDHICRVGSNLAQGDMERAQKYLTKALDSKSMQGKLKDTFVDYILNSPHEQLKIMLK